MKNHYVYLTINLITGKQYVGDHTINPKEKKYYIGSGKPYFESAKNKYGEQNFFKEILEWFETREEAFNAQKIYIEKFNTLTPNGYNISPHGGYGVNNSPLNEETKQKISISLSGENHPAYGKNTWMKGKNHSEESKKKMSEAKMGKTPPNKGIQMPQKTKNKISDLLSGKNHPNWGKHLSEETKQKIGKNGEGKHHFAHTEDAKRKISLNSAKINLGKKLSEETRKKISRSHLGKKRGNYKIKINAINGK